MLKHVVLIYVKFILLILTVTYYSMYPTHVHQPMPYALLSNYVYAMPHAYPPSG